MIHESLWRSAPAPRFSGPLPNEVDDVIVGAGITGLTAALLLKESGRRVAVFDRECIGAGESGNTSAHLTYVPDTRPTELVSRFGERAASLVWRGGQTAIDLIEAVSARGAACGFQRVPGFLCAPFFGDIDLEREAEMLRADAELVSDAGFDARFCPVGPITGRPAVECADQALFHPLDYLVGLATLVDQGGSVVRDEAEVGEIIADPLAVIVNGETIAASDVIIATHVPIVGIRNLASAALFQAKLYPYSSYVIGAPGGADCPPPGLYFDVSDPYFYLRVHQRSGNRYAIMGGADHKTGQEPDTESRFEIVESALRQLIPSASPERRWSGQVIETDDGLPFIGKVAEHQYIATGYAGNGLTFGTLAGIMLRHAIIGGSNSWRALFDPGRKPSSISDLITIGSENVDYPTYMLRDRLRPPDGSSVDTIPRGGGRVVTIDGRRVAVHRTDAGEVMAVDATCTHMGCLVRWNAAERTWDCPCHGSRFTPEGLVIGGPAEAPLERVATAASKRRAS